MSLTRGTIQSNKTKLLKHITEFVLYVQKNQDTFFALIRNGALITKFTQRSNDYARSLKPQHADLSASQKLLTAYAVSGTISLLREWLENPSDTTPEEIALLILELSLYAEKMVQKGK